MTLTIRAARPGEAATLTDLAFRSKASWGYDAAFMEACRETLTVDEPSAAPALVAELDGAVAGFCCLDGNEVDLFFVDPACMGRGVGRALWEHLIAVAREQGLAEVWILSDPNAEGFYRAMGARRAGEAPSDVFGAARPLPRLVASV